MSNIKAQLVMPGGYFEVSSDQRLTTIHTDPSHLEISRRLSEIRQARDAIGSTTLPIVMERPEHLKRPTHVFIRGAYLFKGDEVQPGVPQSLGDKPIKVNDRLALADWLVRPENPLTARVAVNRFWARTFGIRLVATEEDFGCHGRRLRFHWRSYLESLNLIHSHGLQTNPALCLARQIGQRGPIWRLAVFVTTATSHRITSRNE